MRPCNDLLADDDGGARDGSGGGGGALYESRDAAPHLIAAVLFASVRGSYDRTSTRKHWFGVSIVR
jgi:hypothetical protein